MTNQRLNWKEHIKDVKARAMKKLNINKSLAHKKWGAHQQTLLRIHKMIILPTLRYGDAAYVSASPTTVKTQNHVHHKGLRLVPGTFAVCQTENVLYEAGISTLVEIREQDTARILIRVITHESHPIRFYFMNNKIHDEYATKPKTIKPIFIRAIEILGQLQIDVRRPETTPSYLRSLLRKN
jgi:hypothetical protein